MQKSTVNKTRCCYDPLKIKQISLTWLSCYKSCSFYRSVGSEAEQPCPCMFSSYVNADCFYLIRCYVVTFSYLLVKFFHIGKFWNDTSWTAVSLLAVKHQLWFRYRRICVRLSIRRTGSITSRMFVFAFRIFRIFRLISRLLPFKHDRLRHTNIHRISNNKSSVKNFTILRTDELNRYSGEQTNHGKWTTPIWRVDLLDHKEVRTTRARPHVDSINTLQHKLMRRRNDIIWNFCELYMIAILL